MNLVALKEVRYAGVNHVPGTESAEFEATDRDAKILKATGKVRAADHAAVAPARAQSQSDLPLSPAMCEPEIVRASAPASSDEGETKPKRQYRRRDLTAEG